MYNPGLGASLRDVGIKVTEPDTKETWGGRLDNVLVRDDDSKRIMPCSLVIEGSTGQDLIDRVNALKRRLRHAARFRTEGWGDEVFLEFKIDDATHTVRFPVIKGSVDTSQLMKMTNEPNDLIETVARDLRIRDLQLTHEFINPSWEASTIRRLARDMARALNRTGVRVTSGMTGPYGRLNHFGHPDRDVRRHYVNWFKTFADIIGPNGRVIECYCTDTQGDRVDLGQTCLQPSGSL